MNKKIVLAGVGGQGILFATKILSETASRKGYDIIGSETHGMSQRGGSVASFLKIGDFSGPQIMKGKADYLYSYDPSETIRNLIFIRSGGVCFADAKREDFTPQLKRWIAENKITLHTIPAGVIALEMGSPKSANLVLLGFSSGQKESPFTKAELLSTIEAVSPKRFLEANIRCFHAGLENSEGN